jgi:hypothetical protein
VAHAELGDLFRAQRFHGFGCHVEIVAPD